MLGVVRFNLNGTDGTLGRVDIRGVVQALHAGKNVICEKPMAINSAEAQKIISANT